MLVLVNLAVEHPAWSPPPDRLAKLRDTFSEVEFLWNTQQRDYFKQAAKADVIWGWQLSEDIFQLASRLKWFHSCAAGVKPSLSPPIVTSQILLTKSSSVNAPAVSEHLLGLLLMVFRKLNDLNNFKLKRHWGKEEYWGFYDRLRSFDGMTVGIFGYGAIGSSLAAVLKSLGSRILVCRRNLIPAELAEAVVAPAECKAMLGSCGLIVNALPETAETTGFFCHEKFQAMKRGTVFANVGRGKTVDENALARALGYNEKLGRWEESGWLGGAALDVFAEEPLPPESPLWSAPNVVISPHVAAVSPLTWQRQCAYFGANLRRFLNNEPLQGLVDLQAGY